MYSYDRTSGFQCFRPVPKTGVIFVMAEARARGFHYGHPDWANLGQGAPQIGPMEGAPDRLESIPLPADTLEYGPVQGIAELREAVAQLYNSRYRKGMGSQYTADNVVISPGGRAGLTRIAAAMDQLNLGHFIPDYTAYEELLDLFRDFVPIPIRLPADRGFLPDVAQLRDEIVGCGLGALLISNPCNPTGQVISGDNLAKWVEASRDLRCAMIMDEFYSHYLFDDDEGADIPASQSAAEFVEDVDKDPVIIVDGLTKNWRYPGLRLSWTLGPKELVGRIASAASFLDGGAPHAIQKVAVGLLDRSVADQEARAIQKHFGAKRKMMLSRLTEMGFGLPNPPRGSFYTFVSLADLPEPLRDGMDFLRNGLEYNVISVPGKFFDVNPGQRRSHIPSRLKNFARLSYGPSIDVLSRGLDRIGEMIKAHQ